MEKFHTVYKTTNVINGKFYIGKHSTTNVNDNYLGSGKVLKEAIKLYGKKNFSKEILYVFEDEAEAFKKEEELVNELYLNNRDNYNLVLGGKGNSNFTHIDAENNEVYEYGSQGPSAKKKTKETNLKKYGKFYFILTERSKEKNKEICQEKWGVDYPLQNRENKEKATAAILEKYGVTSVAELPVFIEKIKNTNLAKYGYDNWLKNPENYKVYKNTIIEKYNVDHIMKMPEIAIKSKNNREKTMLERYGTTHYMQTEEGKQKARNLHKIRVENENYVHPTVGKIYITDGEKTKAIDKNSYIPDGWKIGVTRGDKKGNKSSNFGTIWINNGSTNVKHPKVDPIPEGWLKGMLIKKKL